MTEPGRAWEKLFDFLNAAGKWIAEHQAEIEALASWSVVYEIGTDARLYVPAESTSWKEMVARSRAAEAAGETLDAEALVVSLYSPGTPGHRALCDELLVAPLLADRRREVQEVLASVADERYYVAVCGALPLVEFVLSRPSGRWKDPVKHLARLQKRMHEPGADDDLDLFIDATAVEMLLVEIPEIWKGRGHVVGAINNKLNRNLALHGSARGWDDQANAVRSVLLLAAAARVASALGSSNKATEEDSG
jgi:hypothetical protein